MPGSPRGNLKELAQQLGVAASTVSRVLNGKAEEFRISSATRDRVLEAAQEWGVVVDHVARGLRLKKTDTVGLVIPDVSNPFFAALARQVEHSARDKGYSVLLADSQERTDLEAESVQLMLSRRVDGLVIAPVGESSNHLQSLLSKGPPLVLVDRLLPDMEAATITADNFEGARMAVQELLDQGHKAIACLQGAGESSVNRDRVRGWQKALLDAGLPPRPEWLAGDNQTMDGGEAAARRILRQSPRPTAILALGSLIALGAMRAIQDRSLTIPDDVSLIAFDEQPWSTLLNPALTTIAQPVEAIGQNAMDRLFAQLNEGTGATSGTLTLPVSLIPRASVGPPPA